MYGIITGPLLDIREGRAGGTSSLKATVRQIFVSEVVRRDITKSNYRKLSRDIDFLTFILTLTDALPKNLTRTLTYVIKMSQLQPKGQL